ncbi:21840_t:CDS:2, partial [Gigaspora rosea]
NCQNENRFGRIEAIVSQSESESNYSDTQIKDALKMSRLLSHNELGIYCSRGRSRRGHNELWIIEENYQIIPSNHVLRHVSIWIEDLPHPFNEINVGDGLRSIIKDQHLQSLLTGWYLTKDLHPENISEEDNDREFYAHIKLHIDDFVIIKEEEEEFYAIIRAIFTHKYNDGLIYAFIWIDWLKNIERTDALLRCPIYERQRESDTRWHRIYPISILNDIPKKNDDGVELKICPIEVENENVTMVHFSRNKMNFDLTDFAEITKMLVESSKKTAAGQAISRNYGATYCHSFFDPYHLRHYFRTLYLDNNPKFELRIEKLLANFVKQGYLDKQKSGFADSSSQAPEKDHIEYRWAQEQRLKCQKQIFAISSNQ